MTAVTQVTTEHLPTSSPCPETTSPSPRAQQPGWSCRATMPPLSEVVSGWHAGHASGDPSGVEEGGGRAGAGGCKEGEIPPHRRKITRTRAAPAGPHPYLDRFSSGMHRPLEGDDATWRKASIQPVPIPDLGHTGIRTKFSSGAGNGFTPNGAMTDVFRNGIHDTVRNIPTAAAGDARDMKTRDYARAIRRHRANPCGVSLLDAHMSSLELHSANEAGFPMPVAWGAAGLGLPLQESCFPAFTDGFRAPSSRQSSRRALVGYCRGGSRGNGEGRGGTAGVGDFRATTADHRQNLLRRELSNVQLAAAAVAGSNNATDGTFGGAADPITRERLTTSSRGGSNSRGAGYTGGRIADSRPRSRPASDAGVVAPTFRGCASDEGLEVDPTRREGREIRGRIGDGSNTSLFETGRSDDPVWRINRRARGRRRDRSFDGAKFEGRLQDSIHGELVALPAPNSSSSSPCWRVKAATATSRRKANRTSSRRRQRYLKKPFSSDSLLSCLLDVRFGNTRDLSPKKPPGQKWDLRTLPVGISVGMSAPAGESWDGLDESSNFKRGCV